MATEKSLDVLISEIENMFPTNKMPGESCHFRDQVRELLSRGATCVITDERMSSDRNANGHLRVRYEVEIVVTSLA